MSRSEYSRLALEDTKNVVVEMDSIVEEEPMPAEEPHMPAEEPHPEEPTQDANRTLVPTRRARKQFVCRGYWFFEWLIGSDFVRIHFRTNGGFFSTTTFELSVSVNDIKLESCQLQRERCGGDFAEFSCPLLIRNERMVISFVFHTGKGLDVKDIVMRNSDRQVVAEFNCGIIRSLWQPEDELYPPEDTASDLENRSVTTRPLFGHAGVLIESAINDGTFRRPPSRLSEAVATRLNASVHQTTLVSAEELEERESAVASRAALKITAAMICFALGIFLVYLRASTH